MKLSVVAFAFLFVAWAQEPPDMDTSYQNLQKALADKNAAQVKKLAVETNGAAKQVIASSSSQPDQVKYAKEVQSYTEYALYTMAVGAPPETAVDLLATLEQQSPKSKYLDDGYSYYFATLSKTGGAAKIPAIAEKAIGNFPGNEDLLLILASTAMERKQADRALSYADRLVAAANKRSKPEGMSAADWEKRKNTALGQGYYISGMVHASKNQFPQANKDLRAAMPYIKDNQTMMAYALFQLGVANYNLGKMSLNTAQMLEGAKFSDQSSMIQSPVQDQAKRNAFMIRKEATGR
jgi:tetratricopeptide (TPR) repeat protein